MTAWPIDNETDLTAQLFVTAGEGGKVTALCIAKSCHSFRGEVSPAAIRPTDVYRGEPGASDLLLPSELVPRKTVAEVIVTGAAPEELSRPALTSLRVGDFLLENELQEGETIPSGWAPLAPNSPERRAYMGEYDARWREERFPRLPEDFDPRFYNAAPAALTLPGFFSGGDAVRIEGLSIDVVESAVPTQEVHVTFGFRDDVAESMVLVIDTMMIDASAQTLEWVWRASCSLQGRSYSLRSCRLHVADDELEASGS